MNEMSDASGVELALIRKAMAGAIPINGSIELLPLCNMNCNMCYVRLDRQQMESQGRMRSADEWLAIAGQMQKAGTLFLLLTGGEPLLYPEFRSLYTSIQKLGIVITVNTNGTLIDEDWAKFFAEHKPRRINITLYGSSSETYDRLCHYKDGFERTVNAIKLLKAKGVDAKLNYSAVSANVSDLLVAFELADQLDVPINVDPYMYPSVRERGGEYDLGQRLSPVDAAKVWIQNLKHSYQGDEFDHIRSSLINAVYSRKNMETPDDPSGLECMASNCSFTINWQGKMRPCVMLSEPSISVFDNGFSDAWNMIRENVPSLSINEKCHSCHLRPLCRICPASAMGECGSYDAVPRYLCEMAEEVYINLQQSDL